MRRILWSLLAILIPLQQARADLPPGVVGCDHFYDVAIVGNDVWVVGFPGLILHSADGGTTFEQQGPIEREALFAVQFVDARTGYISGRGGLVLGTRDGGRTWTRQETSVKEPLLALAFHGSELGLAVGNFATAVRTLDGGRTWARVSVAGEGEDPSLNGVAFLPDGRHAVVVGEFCSAFVSEDAGATFVKVDTGESDNLFSVTATKDGKVVAVGAMGVITVSDDMGKTWRRAASGTERHLFRVTAGNGKLLATGAAGLLLWAEDPASEWHATRLPTYLWVSAARLAEDGRGVAVGARAFLVLTRDGGRTWRPFGGEK